MKRILFLYLSFLMSTQLYAANDTLIINKLLARGNDIMLSQPDSGILIGKEVIKASKKSGIYKGVIKGYNIIGMSYWAKGDFKNGLEYMKKMENTAIQYKDSIEIATAYGNTAILYIDMGDRDLGLSYSKKAVDLYDKIGEEQSQIHYLNNIGWIYEARELYDSSLYYYRIACKAYKKYFDSSEWLRQNICNISSIYYNLNKPDEALRYAKEALAVSDYKRNQKVLGHCYLSMSKALMLNKKYSNAIDYADSAIHLAKTNTLNTLYAEAYWLKYKSNEALGQYKLAIENMALNQKWTDSLVNEKTDIELTKVKTQLATEKKDKALAIAKADNERKLYYLVVATILILTTSIIAYLIYKKQQLRIKAKNRQIELEQKEKELMALELENQELLNHELNKELLTYTLTTAQKNQLLQEINNELQNINNNKQAELRKIKHSVNIAMSTEEDWEEFKLRFEKVHQSFFDTLIGKYPQLTANDLRLCSFIKLNLNSKQIASLLNIAPSSVDISKYRLKKKIGLGKNDNLVEIINNT